MALGPQGVPAPPNEVEIEAKILSAELFSEAPRRWLLQIEVRSSRSILGPDFAHVGQTFRAFATEPIPDLSGQPVIRARAEYVGDEYGGALHLREIALRP
jgi:hypothetical protein